MLVYFYTVFPLYIADYLQFLMHLQQLFLFPLLKKVYLVTLSSLRPADARGVGTTTVPPLGRGRARLDQRG